MKVTVLEDANLRHAQLGWELSRDPAQTYAIEEIAKVDAPVMELPSYLLFFEDFTILEREIFATPRNHVMWARTSRVDNPLDFTVPHMLKCLVHEIYRTTMRDEKDAGATQDTWRYNLPIVANTAWTMRISVRDLRRMQSYFRYLKTQVNEPMATRFRSVADKLAELVGEQPPTARLLNEKFFTLQNNRFVLGEIKFINVNIPLALRAQLVRHRDLLFVDDFYNRFITSGQGLFAQLHDRVNMQLCATDEVWKRILSHRACWIAQADLWEPITSKFGAGILPCTDGVCPFAVDAQARLTRGNDPNPPCPRYMNLHGIPKTAWHSEMMQEAVKRGGQFWMDEVDK